MRWIWSFGFLLAPTGCVSAGRDAPGIGTYTYDDILRPHGHARGEAAEQAATRVCDAGISDRISTPQFVACMRGRGWRLANFQPAPQQYSPSYDAGSSAASSSGPDPSQAANDAANAATQANIAAQQQNDAANAATQQTEYNFNIMYNPQQN